MPSSVCSVVIPVYNTPNFMLRESFMSIQKQTFVDWECVIVDDGSTNDETLRMMKELALHPRVRVVRSSTNSGVGSARNLGIEESRNDIIVVMDSDDWAAPYRLELQVACLLKDEDISIVGGNSEAILPDGRPEHWPTRHPATPTWQLAVDQVKTKQWLWWFTHGTLAYRRSAVREIGGYGHRKVAVDVELGVRLLAAGFPWVNLPETLLRIRRRDGSVSSCMDEQIKAQREIIEQYVP